MTNTAINEAFEINWYFVFASVYSIGILGFFVKFAFDFYSLSKVLKGKTIQHQADFKFIDVKENVSPFSYFNSIVYNSSLYSKIELENILEHEKVHSAQYHTVDVLISRLFCIVFWFNPVVWLYKKAILQNLEFIADSEASKIISDKKAYQLTLLKITTQENCVVLTNHFYQPCLPAGRSLIKKRIVMLNKNQSNKRNSWKYALVLPVLGAFVFFFQVEVIAQEKESALQEITTKETPFYIAIDKDTSEKEMKESIAAVKSNYDVTLKFLKIKRNSNGEIIAIKGEFKNKKGRSGTTETVGTKPIQTFYFVIKGDEMGFEELKNSKNNKNVVISKNPITDETIKTSDALNSIKLSDSEIFINGTPANQTEVDNLDPNEIESVDVTKNSDKGTIRIATKEFSKKLINNIIYIDDKKVDHQELLRMDNNTIDKMDVNKNEKTIRITTKKINQSADSNNRPIPPTPPTPPTFTFKTPKPPVFPKAPKAPKSDPINGDKKGWKDFDNRMEDFNKKMEALEPQMKAFDKQMEEFDKQMEPFNKAMEAFEKKMTIYESQMQDYEAKMNVTIKK